MRFSRTLAIVFGFLAPIADTVRRWNSWRDFPPALFDDYIMGALLLAGAWLAARNFDQGQRLLAAAWGFTCGMGYYSFFDQLRHYQLGEIDPAPISSGSVLAIKGVGVLLAIAALLATLKAKRPMEPIERRRT
ncbi:MAG TPA: hypothetical protein VGW39_16055 [Chthoniobacterales bacterium]|nr:hypothetical protein [Chthoniobacterales bacterium]